MLEKYLFVYSNKDGSFPVRIRIIREGKDVDIPDLDELTDTVNKENVETLRTKLRKKYPAPEFDVSTAWANTWKAVQNSHGGMDYEYDPPFSGNKGISYSAPETDSHKFGEFLFETSATGKTKAIFLLGALLSFGAIAVLWNDFSASFGGVYGWFLTLIYNPLFAIPGFIVPVSLVAGIIASFRLVYYMRVKVQLHEHGIQMQPGNRSARWDEVEHICYAQRSLRPYGIPVPMRQSLSLQLRGQRPINLPHRFNLMEHLISLACERAEPFLLDRAVKRLHAEGSVSFGKLLAITHDNLILNSLKVSIPLKQVDDVYIHGGTFQVVSRNQVVFSRVVESIPDATIISGLLAEIKR